MNIAICDDNNDYINTLENYIDDLKVKNLEHDVFYSGEELLNEYKNNEANYDAIFMDMEMGELDGIETANLIRQFDRNVIIVFVTSHKKYMQRSFQCMPFRFLIKPINFSDFEEVFREVCIKLDDDPETFIFLENATAIGIPTYPNPTNETFSSPFTIFSYILSILINLSKLYLSINYCQKNL